MKKYVLALMAALTVFGATAYATPAQAATHSAVTPSVSDGWVMVVYFDTYPPSTYIDPDSGFYGFLIGIRQISNGMYEGTYLMN